MFRDEFKNLRIFMTVNSNYRPAEVHHHQAQQCAKVVGIIAAAVLTIALLAAFVASVVFLSVRHLDP